MVVKQQFQSYGKVFIFICAATVVLSSSFTFAAEQRGAFKPVRYRVFSLRHISAEQGKGYLAEAKIGTVSQLPGPNTLLVTAQPAELIKASAILKLVDAKELFCVKAIFPASEANNLPSNEQIEAEIGNMSIGTFFELPRGAAKAKAIIDTHGDAVIAVAPVDRLERIVSAINSLLVNRESYLARATSEEQRNANEDKLFNKLLGSLAEAEKRAAEQAQQPSQPNEPAQKLPITDFQLPIEEPKLKTEDKVEQSAVETEQIGKVAEPVSKVWSYEAEPIADGNEMLELDLPETLNIVDLFDLVGKYLHLDYMYDPAKVKGEVTLKVQGPIKVKGLYPLLESVLKFRGFVMTRKGNLVTVVPAAEVLNIDPVLHPDKVKVKLGDVVITRLFKLKHIDTTSAKNLLTGMRLGANITPIAETGTLIVTGYAYRMARIEEVLEMIDKPGEPKQFRFRQLRYTMAKTLAPKIKTLAEQLGAISVAIAEPVAKKPARGRKPPKKPTPTKPAEPTVYLDADERTNRILMIGLVEQLTVVDGLIDALDVEQQDLRTLRLYDIQHVGAEEVMKKLGELGIIGGGRATSRISTGSKPANPAPATTSATKEPLVEEPQVVVVESTNSLLVNATAEQHARIAVILGYVDSETLEEAIPYEIYALENQDPEDLAEVLQKLIQETIKDKEGKIEKVIKKQEDIVIVPDENTFSIIVYASRKNQEWIGKLIRNLDKRRPQVLIDVTLVEISKTDAFQYDLELISSFPDLDRTSGLVDSITGTTTSAIMSALSTAWDRNRFIDASSKAGTGKGFYADEHIHALLTLMQQKDYGRVLAKPKILVNDNETGTINTENTTYVARSSEAVTATGEATVSTSFTFDAFTSGISLDITPHISEGDLLRLEISMSRSNQETAGGTNAPPPDKTENKINTIVTVPDDSTIILGGILTLDQDKKGSKVPILSDIPLVGGLFRNIDNSNIQTKLYIFVKANILRPGETEKGLPDLERISDRNRFAFEESEKEMQEYQQWPGMDSEPMDPLRVLDAE